MSELLTAAQMRAIEQAAIESGEVTGLELMERAGQGVVEAIFEEWPDLEGSGNRAVVLCGPGNNGGDGFVVARLLHERHWQVEVFLYGDSEKLPPDAKVNYAKWLAHGTVNSYVDEGEDAFCLDPSIYRENTVLVDALFGTGLTRPVESFNAFGWVTQVSEWKLAEELRFQSFPAPRVVSVDIPSGVCADSGVRLAGETPVPHLEEISADLTVSFHSKKLGHVLGAGPALCGKVVVADIGLSKDPVAPRRALAELHNLACPGARLGRVVAHESSFQSLPLFLPKRNARHKFDYGHALVVSGGPARTGAARLSARGALRIGAGLVTVGSPRAALAENAAHLTAIMLRQIDGATELAELLEDKRINALCLGPGLGRSSDKQALVVAALQAKRATVLDADALTMFGENPQVLFDLLHDKCVLSPHGGEFATLFPDIAAKLKEPAAKGPAYSKVDATREAAMRAGCVVLFKGADTVIADPLGRCSVNSAHYKRSAPWLATAGSGDVLAGFITGLLARGLSPMQAAEIGAWLHVECALQFGPGLTAEDLPEQIPDVFRRLEV